VDEWMIRLRTDFRRRLAMAGQVGAVQKWQPVFKTTT